MRPLTIFLSFLLLVFTSACSDGGQQKRTESPEISEDNPFLQPSRLDFQTADFSNIEASDFKPALLEGIDRKLDSIQNIANNPDPATFENTLVALEKSGQLLERVKGPFFLLTSANTNDTLKQTQEAIAPKLASLHDALFLNDKLFQRVKSIYDKRDQLELDPESKRLTEYYYNQFLRAGAKLSDASKEKLKKLNEEEASLSTQFTSKLMDAATNAALVVDDPEELEGLSESAIESAKQNAKSHDMESKYRISLDNTTQQSYLQDLSNRSIRKKLFNHSWSRAEQGGENDTRKTITRLAEIRAQKAQLLGFDTYAEWKLQNQMANKPETVKDFLDKLVPPATDQAHKEADELQQIINEEGKDIELEPWDWNYYAEKLRKAKYELDEDNIKPYFELDNVLENGVFYAANQLYGLTFKEREDLPVYHKDVRVFEVYDKNGENIGLFYCDYFKRDNKNGGAWMSNIVGQSKLLNTKPVIYNVANFNKPSSGQPALLTWDNVTTMFHEFGHALHGFFANQKYPSLSGTSVARDFVEFPSQFNEHWALNSTVFEHYAVHYKTGEPMPQELAKKIKKSSDFNQGYMLTELLAAAALDMQWHTLGADTTIDDVDQFEKEALKQTSLYLENVPPRYRSSYFQHIWGNAYSAGYYAYLWTEMLSEDAFRWFQKHGGMTRENGKRFRKMILSKGNTEDLAKMYRNFVGHKPNIEPMLEARGIDG